jgi:steroid 5-alpha reductase family enzyme
MSFWPVLAVAIATAVVMAAGWLWQKRTRNAGIVDIIWSGAMAASAVFYAIVADGAPLPRTLVALLGGVWGLRLGAHLAQRVFSEDEDGRYRYLRSHWHDDQTKFFGFFMAQALFTAIFSLPFLVAANNPQPAWTAWSTLALVTFIVSLAGEAIADRQLALWRADPANRGRTCRAGLWRYSRHPNYFFECLHWFTYVFLAIGMTGWLFALSFLGPVLMLISLCWLTGIPFVEAQALRSRGDDYREYQRTTSVLIPWPPKR